MVARVDKRDIRERRRLEEAVSDFPKVSLISYGLGQQDIESPESRSESNIVWIEGNDFGW